MNLEDIPKIRKQLQALHDDYEAARSDHIARIRSIERVSGAHEGTARQRIEADWRRAQENYDIGTEQLQNELFGTDFASVDTDRVLDWIEHFLEVTCPKT